jgi:hypothetical protein
MEGHIGTSGQGLMLDLSGIEITATKFTSAVQAFHDLIKEVAKTTTGMSGGVRWVVVVTSGSARIEYIPRAVRVPASDLPGVLDAIEGGIAAVESASNQPSYFSERALELTSRLASLVDGREGDVDRVRIWRERRAHDLTLRTVAYVDSLFGIEARDWGTIEGVLETITGRRGLEFRVTDRVTNRVTRCIFDEDMIEDVTGAFMHRVSVSGLIRYRKDGEPVSIRVEEFQVFPPATQLPDFEEVRGILKGAV